jgi:hypothetical protein
MKADLDQNVVDYKLCWTDTPIAYDARANAWDYRAGERTGSRARGLIVGTPGADGIIVTLDLGTAGTDRWIPASQLTACPYMRLPIRGLKATATIDTVERTTSAHDVSLVW